jgi:hypothetical protein
VTTKPALKSSETEQKPANPKPQTPMKPSEQSTCDRCHQLYSETTSGTDSTLEGMCPACAVTILQARLTEVRQIASFDNANLTTWQEARALLAQEFSVRLQQEADRFRDLARDAAVSFVRADASGEHFLHKSRAHLLREETFREAAALIAKQGTP